ncbi:MAG TPA: HlyD family efflux transporter periplasmic adaptor subunit [Candidatus Cybelea sp.]|nr:HlyD family efflux transporter periplasmic adaptor subunit [Candidatus Cybelea sp.]
MNRPRTFLLALALASSAFSCRQTTVLATDSEIPTATVKEVDLQLKVFTTGVLRTVQSRAITAPPIGGGTLQIVTLARAGAQVHTGDVVLEFDPSQQEYNLGQSRSDLLQAEQEIVKAKADADVQTAEDQTALLKAKYAVRRAELEVSKNELVSTIDAQKNLLALDEAKRALAQLQQDIQSHSASNQAALAISEEKRHKARLSMEQAELNIKRMHITSPIDGLVVIHGNRDSTGGFFMDGMTLPDYHVGDQVNPGSPIAEVIDMSHLEVSSKIGETDRINLKAGQSVELAVGALPGEKFSGKVQTVGGATSHEFWDDNQQHTFDVTVGLDRPDPRLHPGFAVRLSILGDNLSHAVSIPGGAIFEHDGKKVVYCKRNRGFEMQEVKVSAVSEGRAILKGLSAGTVVALVNPEKKSAGNSKSSGSSNPSLGPGSL